MTSSTSPHRSRRLPVSDCEAGSRPPLVLLSGLYLNLNLSLSSLPRHHDLPHGCPRSSVLGLRSLDEVHPRCQRPHIIRARLSGPASLVCNGHSARWTDFYLMVFASSMLPRNNWFTTVEASALRLLAMS